MPVPPRAGSAAPIPLLVFFGVFVAAIVYLVAASLTRRDAPVFAATPLERTRAPGWERGGDTITIDATDGERWQYVSLSRGRVLTPPDTNGWDLAVQRYRVRLTGAAFDLGPGRFESVATPAAHGATTGIAPLAEQGLGHWYRYNMLTHLLEPNGHVYSVAARGDSARVWKLVILSYYCPGLSPGCLTLRYAPLVSESSAIAGEANATARP